MRHGAARVDREGRGEDAPEEQRRRPTDRATGRWYVAGENGPEPIFVPSTGGAVAFTSSGMAKTMGMGHGGDVHFHIGSIQGSDPHAVVERMERRARTKLAAVG